MNLKENARPMMIYVGVGMLAINFAILPLITLIASLFGSTTTTVTYPVLPTEAYYLIGSMFGIYSTARSYDKSKEYVEEEEE